MATFGGHQTFYTGFGGYQYFHTGYLVDSESVYVKDINNKLSKFLGTWTGSSDGKNYEFKVSNRTVNNGAIKKDQLVMHYKITDNNGNIIESTYDLSDDNPITLKQGYMEENENYVFSYSGKDTKCGQNGSIYFMISKSTPTVGNLFLQVAGRIYPNCDTGPADQIFPQQRMTISK